MSGPCTTSIGGRGRCRSETRRRRRDGAWGRVGRCARNGSSGRGSGGGQEGCGGGPALRIEHDRIEIGACNIAARLLVAETGKQENLSNIPSSHRASKDVHRYGFSSKLFWKYEIACDLRPPLLSHDITQRWHAAHDSTCKSAPVDEGRLHHWARLCRNPGAYRRLKHSQPHRYYPIRSDTSLASIG